MKLRISGLLAIVAFAVTCSIGSAQNLAQNAYITNEGSNPPTVSVIDTATNTVTATIAVGSNPLGVAMTPDGSKAYVANAGSNTVSGIDTATNTVTATIPVGVAPVAFGNFIQPVPKCRDAGGLKLLRPECRGAGSALSRAQCRRLSLGIL
jgi:YVTN family beta-propeller protein